MGELPKPFKSVRITDSKTFVYQPFFLNVEFLPYVCGCGQKGEKLFEDINGTLPTLRSDFWPEQDTQRREKMRSQE